MLGHSDDFIDTTTTPVLQMYEPTKEIERNNARKTTHLTKRGQQEARPSNRLRSHESRHITFPAVSDLAGETQFASNVMNFVCRGIDEWGSTCSSTLENVTVFGCFVYILYPIHSCHD